MNNEPPPLPWTLGRLVRRHAAPSTRPGLVVGVVLGAPLWFVVRWPTGPPSLETLETLDWRVDTASPPL
jgi:hypothetical protein